jgi:hypothetical protein
MLVTIVFLAFPRNQPDHKQLFPLMAIRRRHGGAMVNHRLQFFLKSRNSFQFTGITNSTVFPVTVERFSANPLVKTGIANRIMGRNKFLLQNQVPLRRMGISLPQPGTKTGLPFKHKKKE